MKTHYSGDDRAKDLYDKCKDKGMLRDEREQIENEMNKVIYPPCRKCGASHGMGIETMATGEIEPLDICGKCLWGPVDKHIEDILKQGKVENELDKATRRTKAHAKDKSNPSDAED